MTDERNTATLNAIAIIGMAGRFPGAADVGQFWRNLEDGVESVTFFSRAELATRGVAANLLDDPCYVGAGAIVDGIEMFDADFFGLTPREASLTDPQHRVFLECAWEALEDSGYDAETYEGQIGVYAGAGLSTYLLNCVLRRPDIVGSAGALAVQLGNNKDYVPLRVSYKLHLRGPSVNVNTACSSSLVAVHLACQSLIDQECDIALAGGVGIQVPQDQGYLYAPNGILSPDGHCRPFDAQAQGTVSGNGAGLVVLKRYVDALADGDAIRAVILGSAINNDGAAKAGFTAPSVAGQARVIGEALAVAPVDPSSLGYVEAHGTGTPLGDPIEVAALCKVFRAYTERCGFCALGSVKSNVGHLDEAAGIAGLIKVVLSLQHAAIPPSLHFERANPEIDLEHSPFYVPTGLIRWDGASGPRRAAVSSFGLGGTNAHAVLQEAPAPASDNASRPWQLVLLSARTATALAALTARLAAHLRRTPDVALADVAYTLQVGRKEFSYRRMLVCRDLVDAEAGLEAGTANRCVTACVPAQRRSLVFLFPGQGSHYLDMGRGLYRTERRFRDTVDRCAELLLPQLGFDLRDVLYPEPERAVEAKARLDQTAVAQPALFTVEYALSQLLLGWGIEPLAMSGHSLGEYVAACLAGVFSVEDSLGLVAARGALMQKMATGSMLAVELAEAALLPLLGNGLSLAGVNAPTLSVAAGPLPALAALEARLSARGIAYRRLHTSHAFHSEAMDPVRGPFLQRMRQVTLGAPTIPFVSNVTGRWITAAEATDPNYWVRHLRSTVRFSQGLELLLNEGNQTFLEVGPGQALSALVRRHPECAAKHPVIGTMRHPNDPRDDCACLLDGVGQLWLAGVCRKPSGLHAGERRRRVPLPTYPFERRRFWVDPPADRNGAATDKPVEDWFYVPTWQRRLELRPGGPVEPRGDGCLVFLNSCGLGNALVGRLRRLGRRVTTVVAGARFSCDGDSSYVLNPARADDYRFLFEQLSVAGGVPRDIVHLWSVTRAASRPREAWDAAQVHGFFSLLYLVQAADRQGLTEGLAIDVVSTHMQPVLGDEVACPEKATVLGLIRVAPKEYPGLRCRSVDLIPPASGGWDERTHLEPLLSVLASDDRAAAIAIRNGAIWQQDFTPRRLPLPPDRPPCLREGGTYLITGGLGSMGLAMARYLAREVRARLILLGRTGLPPGHLTFDPGASTDLVQSFEAAAERKAALFDIDADIRLTRLMRAFCAALIGRYFATCGVVLDMGQCHHRAALRRQLQLLPAFDGFLDFLLRCLAEDGIVALDGDRVTFLENEIVCDFIGLRQAILSDYPQFGGLLRLLEHCASHYRPALSGEIPAISVLYPDGTSAFIDECGRGTPAYARDSIYLETAARLLAHIAAQPVGRTLRILEVGGGSGGLTRTVLPALKGHAVEYWFTDISPSFVGRAQQEASANGIDVMRFGVLDIAQDPEAQGHAAHSFDIVLGYNVVHATPRIEDSLAQLRRLLAPGGLLILVEATRLRRWDQMVWGLTGGWWHFADRPLRNASPLIGLDAWEDVLRRQRYDVVTSYPREPAARRSGDVGMLVALRKASPGEAGDDPTTAAVRTAVGDIAECGGEVLVIRADVADATQMRAALAQARARFGPPDGVIHTAGILGQGLIHGSSVDDFRPVFGSKAVGLLVLEALLAEQAVEPDFLILCSSLAALAPIIGQVGYCAASAFLDAYAAHRSGAGRTATLAIDWGFWQELGMIEKAKMPEAVKQQIRDEIQEKGRTRAGIEAFRCILGSCPVPQVLVVPDNADTLIPIVAAGKAGPTRPSSEGVRHPWFDDQVVEGTSGIACVSHFDTRHWVLDEHRPLGEAVLPGTAFLEMARAALDVQGSGRPIEWRDVYFLSPFVVSDGETREVRTILTKRNAGFDFVVASRIAAGADEWLEHARGEIAFLMADPPHPLDLTALERRCQTVDLAIPESAASGPCHGFADRVRQFAPHWRCFERLRLGADEGLATLRLAPEFVAELDVLRLHPALADMATGYLSMVDGFEAGVPFCYRRLRLWHPLRSRVHSHVRSVPSAQPAERSYDATICDDQGTVLLDAVGLAFRSLDRRRAAEPAAAAQPEAESNFCAEIEHAGSLATLGLRPAMRCRPGPGEVEIEVAAAGLNFIEVLYALGMLPDPPGGEGRFGLECAGSVVAVGDKDVRFRPGDRVFGFAPSAFSRFTTAAASGIAHMPKLLSFAEAATLPVAFATAYYALITRGRLRRGERVLIHAAAGGVGLAAVNIAQSRGAEVFATAGSPEKRDYLRSQGIRHVWDSRSLDFVGHVLGASGGRGVDLVLNSLGGEFIPASLSVLARYGRFLELGKRDILRNAGLGLAPFEKHLSFTAIDVGIDLPEFDTIWRQVARAVSRNAFRPLPYREFPISRLADAFDHMAQARHIGKVVIAIQGANPTMSAWRRSRGRPLDDILCRGAGMRARTEKTPAVVGAAVVPTDPSHSRPPLTTSYRPPRGATEALVVAIWEELLGVSGIGADDNFFELRGDSLLAAQATSRLYAAFQVKLPLSSVFENPTPAGLAERIDQTRLSLRELATAPVALPAESEVEHEL